MGQLTSRKPLRLEPFQPEWLSELVLMWRESFEAALGIVDPHPIAQQEAYFLERVLPHYPVRVAWQGERMVGFIAASEDKVEQLFVRKGWQRRGIGGAMLAWAKQQSRGELFLFAFARNANACAFYEYNGFTIAARGFEPQWQLDDVRYVWVAPAA
jgi:GNAT superfamily N-acetyltransferase